MATVISVEQGRMSAWVIEHQGRDPRVSWGKGEWEPDSRVWGSTTDQWEKLRQAWMDENFTRARYGYRRW